MRFRALTMVVALLAAAVPARAQSVLRDAESEALLRDMMTPLAKAGGLEPKSVQVLVIGDPSINAFVTGGQNIFFHSGLLVAATDVNQVQGVMAHELGHITGGHGVRFNEGAGAAQGISILGLIAGAALIAAGAGEAGMAAMMGSQQAAMGKFLAFTRDQESRADQAGAQFLIASGTSGKGMISFFRLMAGDEYRLAIKQDNSYNRTHPLNRERISALETRLEAAPTWAAPPDPRLQARYQRVRAKLIGFVSDPDDTLRAYPLTDTSAPARYARAFAFHKQAFPDKALAEVNALLRDAPDDPYYLELKGQVMLESGRVADSIAPLRRAVAVSGSPLIGAMLGHALVLTDTDASRTEAEAVLKAAVARDNDNPFAWLQLGTLYDRRGDVPRAALASAERLSLSGGDPRAVNMAARTAMAGLPKGTPEWIRAQDISLVSKDAMDEKKERRR